MHVLVVDDGTNRTNDRSYSTSQRFARTISRQAQEQRSRIDCYRWPAPSRLESLIPISGHLGLSDASFRLGFDYRSRRATFAASELQASCRDADFSDLIHYTIEIRRKRVRLYLFRAGGSIVLETPPGSPYVQKIFWPIRRGIGHAWGPSKRLVALAASPPAAVAECRSQLQSMHVCSARCVLHFYSCAGCHTA